MEGQRKVPGSSSAKSVVWQLLLVSNMIGIEGFLATQFVALVTNIRVLGVPVSYSSLPSFFAAILSGLLIVGLSFVGERYATSKTGKAILLVIINSVQYIGAGLIILGNAIKLMYYNDYAEMTSGSSTQADDLEDAIFNLSPNENSSIEFSRQSNEDLSLFKSEIGGNGSRSSSYWPSPEESSSQLPFPYYAAMVMAGFSLLESGFDAGNCFLKTYALACCPPHMQSTVLVKSTFIASFGGLFVTLLGSLSVGEWLTAGTNYNVNAARTLFITSVGLVIGLLTLTVSLVAGYCCCCSSGFHKPEVTAALKRNGASFHEERTDETTKLLPGGETNSIEASTKVSVMVESSVSSKQISIMDSMRQIPKVNNQPKTLTRTRRFPLAKAIALFKGNEFRIGLCLGTLFGCWATFSFTIYSVNFMGVAIYHGDPTASVNSEEYANYLEGETSGSKGLLALYVSYMLTGSVQNVLIQRFGWWREASVASVIYLLVTFSCAFFLKQWLFFAASTMTGFYRAMLFTVPYLLITKTPKNDKASTSDSENPTNGVGIALIAALWPSSFLIAAATTGPLLEATGSSATSMYAAATATTLSLLFYWSIRKH